MYLPSEKLRLVRVICLDQQLFSGLLHIHSSSANDREEKSRADGSGIRGLYASAGIDIRWGMAVWIEGRMDGDGWGFIL